MLSPTSTGAQYHSLRVFYQVQFWKGNSLNAEEWGWKICNRSMVPISTDKDTAPQSLLKLVRCTWKSGCGTLRCDAYATVWNAICSERRGVCENVTPPDDIIPIKTT